MACIWFWIVVALIVFWVWKKIGRNIGFGG